MGALFNLCLYGALICVSLFLQEARHESALATGLLILPMSVAVAAGSLASGWLTARFGPRRPMIAGLTLAAAGAAVLATVGETTPLAVLVAGSVVLGLTSLAMPAMTAAVVGTAGPENAGVASGVLNAARQAGGALGVAVLGALLVGGGSGNSGAGNSGGGGHALSLHEAADRGRGRVRDRRRAGLVRDAPGALRAWLARPAVSVSGTPPLTRSIRAAIALPMLLASGCPPIAKPGAGNVGRQGLSHDIQGADQ